MMSLGRIKTCGNNLVLVLVLVSAIECIRFGGGGSRSSYSRPSYSRPSYSRPSYSHPSPSYSHPSPSNSHPSPSYTHPSPSYSLPSRIGSPASFSYPTHPSPSRPIGFDVSRPAGLSSGHNSGSGSHSGSTGSHSNSPIGPPVVAKPVNSAPNYGFSSSVTHGSGSGGNPPPIGFKPSVTHGTQNHGTNVKPSAPIEHTSNVKPVGNANSGSGHTSNSGSNPPPYGFKPSAPVGPPTNVKPVASAPPGAPYLIQPPPYTPHNYGHPPPAYNPAHNPAGYGPPPAYNPAGYGAPPAYSPGYGHGSYPQQAGGYHPQGGYGQPHSGGGVTIINNNNYNTHSNHHYGGGYGAGFGYQTSYPSYHYSSNDVGSGTLGFFLGYSLAKITTPTYHYSPSFYSGYTPRYDHYEVHHYYHNRDSIPAQSTIQPNAIVGCIGDSSTICPTGTTSLCTSNGAILCVASATTTVPCTDKTQGNCVRTIVPCVNGTGDCQNGQNKTLTIPCISSAKVMGNITYVNNTIIVNNTTVINNTSTTVLNNNGTAVTSTNATVQNGTIPLSNLTVSPLASENTNGTTTISPNVTSDGTRTKRETNKVPVNEFCVTILALPAERKPTEQEKLLSQGTSIFSKFLVKALGVN